MAVLVVKKMMQALFAVALVLAALSQAAQAQVPTPVFSVAPAAQAQLPPGAADAAQGPPSPFDQAVHIPFRDTLFFTPREYTLLAQAKSGIPVTAQQAAAVVTDTQTASLTPVVQEPIVGSGRKIKLAGIVYTSAENWVIWLNGKRLTPGKSFPEIVDIKVEKEKVHLKWYDIGLDKILSITLRSHQIYDIETGVLLPG